MSAHTEGRLEITGEESFSLVAPDSTGTRSTLIAIGIDDEPDARRLAACWNSFIGVSTEDIEAMGGVVLFKGEPVGELAELRTKRDQLRAERSDLQLEARHREEVNQVLVSQLSEARALLCDLADELKTEGMDCTVERIRALLNGGEA